MQKGWLKPINGLIKKFPSIYQFFNGDDNKFILLLRKIVYPYEYMIVFEEFKLKNLSDYHDLYVQSDTLVADVLENFRDKRIEIYELDPAHFYLRLD